MQIGLAIAQRLERARGLKDVVTIGAGTAVTLPHVVQALVQRQPPGILHMTAIDDEAERPHLPLRSFLKFDTTHRFQINGGNLLAYRK